MEPYNEVVSNHPISLSNTFILKYKYSKKFNNHYRAQAILVKQKAIDKENASKQGGEYLKKELEMCKRRV